MIYSSLIAGVCHVVVLVGRIDQIMGLFCKRAPQRRSQDQIFSPGKIFHSPKNFSEFCLPNSVSLCSFLGLWSGFINPPLQSLVNQYFSQIFERLFSKKKHERESPRGWGVVKCREFERKNLLKWVVSISRDYWICFEITWKSSKNTEFWEKVPRIETFFSSKFDPATGVKETVFCKRNLQFYWSYWL